MHTAVLTNSGRVLTWGVNDEGALGRHTEGEAWKANQHLVAKAGPPGDSYTPAAALLPAGAPRVARLSAGDSHTVALTRRGSIYAWGTFRDTGGVWAFSASTRIAVRLASPASRRPPASRLGLASYATYLARAA